MRKLFLWKRVRIALELLLVALCITLGFLLYYCKQSSDAFRPVRVDADPNTIVGQMRVPELYASLLDNPDNPFFTMEFLEYIPGDSSSEIPEGYDEVRFKKTPKRSINAYGESTYWLLRYCPEDGFWYAIYNPNEFIRTVAYSADSHDMSSTTCYARIPKGLISRPGRYAIAIEQEGILSFELE